MTEAPHPAALLSRCLLSAVLLLTGCTRVGDEMPRVVPPSGDPAAVAMPSLPARPPAPCTTPAPDPLTAAAAGNRYDEAAASRAQDYLDAHPDDAGSLIVNATADGSGLHAGFVAGWCAHRDALRRIVGGTPVEVFAVVQSDRAGRLLTDRIVASVGALGRAGTRIATIGVDPRTGLTAVTTPDDPGDARAAIVRELGLRPDAPVAVSRGDLPIPAVR